MKTKSVNFSIAPSAQEWIDENSPGSAFILGLISQANDEWMVGWYTVEKVSAPTFPGFVAKNSVGDKLVIVQTDTASRLENTALNYDEGKFGLSTD